jgi:rhodanese-related sulfurtransferase
MAAPGKLTVAQLSRLIGTPDAPRTLDLRIPENRAADPRVLPANYARDYASVSDWAADYTAQSVVVVCQRGLKLSQGVIAWLRQSGAQAEVLEGGFEAWQQAKGLLILPDHVPRT